MIATVLAVVLLALALVFALRAGARQDPPDDDTPRTFGRW
jgi:hypothetical protein